MALVVCVFEAYSVASFVERDERALVYPDRMNRMSFGRKVIFCAAATALSSEREISCPVKGDTTIPCDSAHEA